MIFLCLELVEQLQKSVSIRLSWIINRLYLSNMDGNNPHDDILYLKVAALDSCFKFYWIHGLQLPVHMKNCLKKYYSLDY